MALHARVQKLLNAAKDVFSRNGKSLAFLSPDITGLRAQLQFVQHPPPTLMLELIGKTDIDFLGRRRVTFAVSAALVLLGLFALTQIVRGAANLSIDFTGGTSVPGYGGQLLIHR